MAFGFSPSDFILAAKMAKGIYKACKNGPEDYKEVCRETKSLKCALDTLSEDAKDPQSVLNKKAPKRKTELDEIISNCMVTMEQLQTMIDSRSSLKTFENNGIRRVWDAYKVGSTDLEIIRGKLTFYTAMIGAFLSSLQGTTLGRIESKVDKILARILQDSSYDVNQNPRQSAMSLISTHSVLSQVETQPEDVWEIMKAELMREDILMTQIMAHKDDIMDYIRKLVKLGSAMNLSSNESGPTCSTRDELMGKMSPSSPPPPSLSTSYQDPLLKLRSMPDFARRSSCSDQCLIIDVLPGVSRLIRAGYIRACFGIFNYGRICFLRIGFEYDYFQQISMGSSNPIDFALSLEQAEFENRNLVPTEQPQKCERGFYSGTRTRASYKLVGNLMQLPLVISHRGDPFRVKILMRSVHQNEQDPNKVLDTRDAGFAVVITVNPNRSNAPHNVGDLVSSGGDRWVDCRYWSLEFYRPSDSEFWLNDLRHLNHQLEPAPSERNTCGQEVPLGNKIQYNHHRSSPYAKE